MLQTVESGKCGKKNFRQSGSCIITVFYLVLKVDFVSNATSNRYLAISLIKKEYLCPN